MSQIQDKTKLQKILSTIEYAIIFIIFGCSLLCLGSNIYNKMNNISPLFLGYSYMEVKTGSMEAPTITIDGVTYKSGHKAGEKIIVHTVDTKTLGVGDAICFYVNYDYVNQFYTMESNLIVEENELEFKTTIADFFGFHNNEIKESGIKGCDKIFHHITAVFEDSNGVRWFKTRGSSNSTDDGWITNENLVIGAYEETKTGSIIASLSNFLVSGWGLIVICSLIIIISFSIYIKQIERIKKKYQKNN